MAKHPDDVSLREVLAQAPTPIDAVFIGQFGPADSTQFTTYGVRLAALGMRERSLDRVREGLLAIAVGAAVRCDDDRDLMVALALPHAACTHIGADPAAVFDLTAERFEAGWLPDLLRVFGARDDVTLAAFGWRDL